MKKDILSVVSIRLKSRRGIYTTLRNNYLINSTRKYDELGDWLYFKLMIQNVGTLVKAAFGDSSGVDELLDNLFYEYNDRHQ